MSVIIASRFIHFAAAMILFGGLGFDFLLRRPPGIASSATFRRAITLVMRGAAVAAALSALTWLMFEAVNMSGETNAAFDPATLWLVLSDTSFGVVWLWRMIAVVALTAVLFIDDERLFVVRLALAALMLASLGLVGHAAMEDGAFGLAHQANHAVHLLATGGWVGGLLPLAIFLRTDAGVHSIEAAKRFSAFGAIVVAAVLLSGALNSWFLLHSAADLTNTDYGRLLLVKILLVGVMLGFALFHRFVLLPRVQAGMWGLARFRRSILAEIAVALAVLGIVSVLGTWPPQV